MPALGFGVIPVGVTRYTYDRAAERVAERQSDPPTVNWLVEPTATQNEAVRQQYQLAAEMTQRADREIRNALYGNNGGFSGDEAEQKSIELLKQWLTPRQLKDFEKTNSFTVQGNVTSKFYKIERRSTFNVGELNTNNQRVRSLCFVPAYAYAIGDIMLAQKIMLETREDEVLTIANFSGGPTDPAGQHLYEQLAETTRRATGRSLFQRVFV